MFKKRMTLFVSVLVTFLLQFSFFPFFSIHGVVPDLLSVCIVFYAYYVKVSRLLIFAVLIGLLKDVYSEGVFGVEMVSACVSAYSLHFMIKKFPQDFMVFRVLTTAIYIILSQLVLFLVFCLLNEDCSVGVSLTTIVLPTVVYTVALSPVALSLYKKVMKESLRQYTLF